MSFLDEADDQSQSRPPRPPRPPRGPDADRQTLVLRRAIAVGAGIVVLLVLVFGTRACAGARKAQAFEDYVTDVGALLAESDQQSDSFFMLLSDPGTQSSVDIENVVNGFRTEGEQFVERAGAIEAPDELEGAQGQLVESLRFRSDGLGGIADNLPTALSDEGAREAVLAIAGQMQNFLASDVIYSQRVIPAIQDGAREADLLDRVGDLPESQFLPKIDWLNPRSVEDAIAGIKGEAGSVQDANVSPGLHGTGLQSVAILPAGVELSEKGTNSISGGTTDLAFEVTIQNQGENDEKNVAIRISIEGGTDSIELSAPLDAIKAGETLSAEVPVVDSVPTNEDLTVDVEVEPVPGEDNVDNNSGQYLVRFGS